VRPVRDLLHAGAELLERPAEDDLPAVDADRAGERARLRDNVIRGSAM